MRAAGTRSEESVAVALVGFIRLAMREVGTRSRRAISRTRPMALPVLLPCSCTRGPVALCRYGLRLSKACLWGMPWPNASRRIGRETVGARPCAAAWTA